nr:hypothetical protein [Tanacetum cinerariifolium]
MVKDDQGLRANEGVEGVNGIVEGVNGGVRGAPDFSTIIAQQLQNLFPAMLAQDGNQENVRNQNGNVVNENAQENVRNVLVNGNRVGCSYKEFLAYNPKEYDGKGGIVVLTQWIEKMQSVQDMCGCSNDQKVKYTAGSFVDFCPSHEIQNLETELWNHALVEVGHAAYTDKFHELARLVPRLVTLESMNIERYLYGLSSHIRGIVAATAPKTIQKQVYWIGNVFASTVNPVRRENTGAWPKCTTYNSYHAPRGPCRTCFNCNRPGHLAKDCRGVPRNVNLVNARNPTIRACYKCGSTDHVRAFMLRAEEARQDLNIMTGTEPSKLGFRYEIKIASGSFDVILVMDWLSNHKAKIICHEKVVRPLLDCKVLRVLGEKLEEKIRQLKSVKAKEKEQEKIAVVRDFPKHNSKDSIRFSYSASLGNDPGRDRIICDLDKTLDLSQRPPQNCPKYGNPVDGHYCQGCALLRKKFKEDLFTYCIENLILQDSFEPSNDNTNVVNALQETFVVKQDIGKNSSQSPPQINHHCCYGCGDSLEDIFCHQCTCELCRKDAHYGYNFPLKVLNIPDPEPFNNQTIDELPETVPSFDPICYSKDGNSFTYDSISNLVHDSLNVFNPPPQPPTYSYEFCKNDAYYGHDCPLQEELAVYINTLSWDRPTICNDDDDDDEDYTITITTILSTEELDNSLSMGDEHLDTVSATESDEFIKSSVENLVPIPSESEGIPDKMCDVPFHDNSLPLDVSKDQFEDFFDSNDDSTSIDDDSFSIDNIKYGEASPPDFELFSLEVIEIVIPQVGGIDDDILLTIKDDILREKLLNINLLIANIEALKDNPTSSSDFMTKSSSTSLNFLLEETNTFDNSLPESKTLCFDLEEISSGSTTTRSDIFLPNYEVFYNDHVKEISSGSTTTHSDSSLYDSFIFDLSINLFPPADMSDNYEFTDELAHIISSPEYDCFCFKNEPNSGDFTMDVVDDIFSTREPRVHDHNVLSTHPTLQLNLDFKLSSESLFAYVLWIILLFLSYSVSLQYLLSFGNEDTIFDLSISSYHISSFMPDVSHQSGTFIKISVHPKHLNESPMKIFLFSCGKDTHILVVPCLHFYPLDQF